jgi:phosphatidylinositol alpha-1,6-mannosyltransferase
MSRRPDALAHLAAPMVAAVTLAEDGGGIAAVSRMTWRVLSEAWPGAQLVTLFSSPVGHGPTRPSLGSQIWFGADVMRRQMPGAAGWAFFNHLALARTQAFLPKAIRRPHVIFLHGIEAWHPLSASTRQVLGDAALLIANSRHTAVRAEQANPGLGVVDICPLAIEWQPGPPTLAGRAAASAVPTVLMVGRLLAAERYKGHDQVLEAWPAVLARVPNATLVIAGGGDDLPRLEAKARDLGVAASVEFRGFVPADERARLYAAAHVFAMPSQGEGFGLVYLEAMAHGVPCIGSNQDAAREVVVDGVTGYLVNQPDIATLAARLVELLTDESRRRSMGENGRARVASMFTYRQFGDRLLSLIGSAAERLGGARRIA